MGIELKPNSNQDQTNPGKKVQSNPVLPLVDHFSKLNPKIQAELKQLIPDIEKQEFGSREKNIIALSSENIPLAVFKVLRESGFKLRFTTDRESFQKEFTNEHLVDPEIRIDDKFIGKIKNIIADVNKRWEKKIQEAEKLLLNSSADEEKKVLESRLVSLQLNKLEDLDKQLLTKTDGLVRTAFRRLENLESLGVVGTPESKLKLTLKGDIPSDKVFELDIVTAGGYKIPKPKLEISKSDPYAHMEQFSKKLNELGSEFLICCNMINHSLAGNPENSNTVIPVQTLFTLQSFLEKNEESYKYLGFHDPASNTVFIDKTNFGRRTSNSKFLLANNNQLAHELSHAFEFQMATKNPEAYQKFKDESRAAFEKAFRTSAKNGPNKFGYSEYSFTNIAEFMAEALSLSFTKGGMDKLIMLDYQYARAVRNFVETASLPED